MDIIEAATRLAKIATVKKIDNKQYEIVTGAKINDKTPIKIFLVGEGKTIKFADGKTTLKYMSQIYELKSADVKNCIASVVKIYGFNIISGELVATIKPEQNLTEVFYNYIICIGQLANMYAFFDQP